jgi:hypothetical protein
MGSEAMFCRCRQKKLKLGLSPGCVYIGKSCLNEEQRAGGVAEVVECLPSNCEVLNSNPTTAKKEKKKS